MPTDHGHSVPTTRVFVWVWSWLLLLTIVEVLFAYRKLSLELMIVILLGLSLMKSALIMAYFMHLKFERLSLVMTLIPALVILICLMFISFPDSVRIHQLTPR
jgi:cytochrome c oxidase subunit IV